MKKGREGFILTAAMILIAIIGLIATFIITEQPRRRRVRNILAREMEKLPSGHCTTTTWTSDQGAFRCEELEGMTGGLILYYYPTASATSPGDEAATLIRYSNGKSDFHPNF